MCGLPIVAKASNGSSILIRNGIDGFIHSQESKYYLEILIMKLISNNELCLKFGAEGKLDALRRFNQNINFLEILKLIQNDNYGK